MSHEKKQKVVVAAFLHDGDEVLLARRPACKAIAPGKYHLPGGHVEFGEHPGEALARELHEELGIRVAVAEPILAFHYSSSHDESHTVGVVYRVPFTGDRTALRFDPGDIECCVWVKEEDIGCYLPPGDHNHQAALAGFALLGGR